MEHFSVGGKVTSSSLPTCYFDNARRSQAPPFRVSAERRLPGRGGAHQSPVCRRAADTDDRQEGHRQNHREYERQPLARATTTGYFLMPRTASEPIVAWSKLKVGATPRAARPHPARMIARSNNL